MLAGLDQIDWASLGDHPRLSEIPAQLRRLISSKHGERELGIEQLRAICIHQSNAEPWSLEVVPPLRELALAVGVAERGPILVLLADLAAGGDHAELVGGGEPRIAALHDAIAADYTALLADDDEAVRAAAALLLAILHHDDAASQAALRAHLGSEKGKVARPSMLLALGRIDMRVGSSGDDGAAFDAALKERAQLSKIAGACGHCYVAAEIPASIAVLQQAGRKPPKSQKGFSWCHGDAGALALRVCIATCVRHGETAPLSTLLDDDADLEVAAGLIRAAFPRRHTLVLPGELDEAHLAILRAVSAFNTSSDELFTVLNARGFVTDQRSLQRFCGAAPPGPLDEVVAGLPLWKHFRDAMDGCRDEVASLLSGMAPPQVLAVCQDALSWYMQLHKPFPDRFVPDWYDVGVQCGKLGVLCADAMAAHVDAEVLAERLSSETIPRGERHWYASLLYAYAARSDAGDASLATYDGAFPKMVTHGAQPMLRPVLARMTEAHRERLVVPLSLSCVRDGSGWVMDGCLPYLDMVKTEASAKRAIEALRLLEEPPVDHLIGVLWSIGGTARGTIAAALSEEQPPHVRAALERAREEDGGG